MRVLRCCTNMAAGSVLLVLIGLMFVWSGCSGETKEIPMSCPDGYTLVDGNCFKACFQPSDCLPGFTCLRGICVYQGGADTDIEPDTTDQPTGCVFDTDCPPDNYCRDDGKCEPIPQGDTDLEEGECLLDSDCPTGMVCNDSGVCINPPQPDGDIPEQDLEPDFDDTIELDENAPILRTSPNQIDFGNVPVGGSAERELTLYNAGRENLVIMNIELETDSNEFELNIPFELPYSIEPNKNVRLTIVYRPQDMQADNNAVLIYSNDPVQNPYRVPILTQIKPTPQIEVEPSSIDFGLRSWGSTYRQSLTIRNTGTADLTLNDLLWSEGVGGAFGLEDVPANLSPSSPYSIAPGEELTITVTFTPNSEGEFSNTLNILSNDPFNYILPVPVSGTGGVADIEVEPLNLDFTGVPVGSTLDRDVLIRNVGQAPLEQIEFFFGQETSNEFSFLVPPPTDLVLNTGEEYTVTVHYVPTDQVADVGSLHIRSNDPDESEVIVRFNAAGSPPDIDVTPTEVHFGVAYPQIPTLNQIVWVRNLGEGVLFLSAYYLETGNGEFTIESGPPLEEGIRQGETKAIHLAYTPTSDQASSDVLIIESNDPDEPTVRVPLDGDGLHENQCPVADAGEGYQIEPFQTITLDGTGSYDPDGYIIAYEWTIVQKPTGSMAQLIPPTSATPRFTCDLAGTYTFRLRVMDNAFTYSCEDDTVTYDCVPSQTLHIQLVWTTDDVDLDLHLIRPNGTYWDLTDDCFYKTCIPTEENPQPLDWGGMGTPTLDIDDTNGYGPENINLDNPGIGTYKVVVFYYDSHNWPEPATDATVRVFVFGVQQFEATAHFDREHLRWDVCEIFWAGNGAEITDLGQQPVLDESHGH